MKDRDAEYSVFWIPCNSFESIEQAFLSVTSALGMQGVDPAEARDSVKAYLSHNVTKWLLILDSVDDLTLWADLQDSLPQSKQGRILVTTRNQRLVASLHVISISEPDGDTGIDILRNALGNKHQVGDRRTAINLLDRLAYLPLAITQAAAYIKYIGPSFTLLDYLELLDEQESKVIELLSADFRDERHHASPVAGTWLVTFQQIQQSDPSAALYLSLMACVNPHNIPRTFLPPLASKRETFSAIGLLDSFSLITVQPEKGSLTLHRLVYLVTRSWMRTNREFSKYLYRAADRLKEIIPSLGDKNNQRLRQYLPHTMSLINEAEFAVDLKYDDLLWKTAHCQYRDGRYKDAQRLFTSIVELRNKEYGDQHADTLTGMAWLAYTYAQQARLDEAEELAARVLQIQNQELGEHHPDTMSTMVHLCSIYRDKGEWVKARTLHSRLLDIYKEALGPTHPTTLSAMADLAVTCSRHGNQEEAERLKLHVLNTRREVLGAGHVDTLTSMHSLARAYSFQGRVDEAKKLHWEVVDKGKKALGLERGLIVASAVALAWIWMDQREWKPAEELLVQVLNATREALGKQHLGTLFAMSNLSLVYLGQGRFREAEDLAIQALDARKDLLGWEHPETLKSMHDLAKIYIHQGRQAEGAKLREQAIMIETKEDTLGPNDPRVIDNLDKLAWDWHVSGRKEEALELKARVVRLRTEQHGPDHCITKWAVKDLTSWREQAETQGTPISEPGQTAVYQDSITGLDLGSESSSVATRVTRRRERLFPKTMFDRARKLVRGP
jgi:tetratricopeptide (TPR) repeat protein